MSVTKMLEDTTQYIFEAVARIFGPSDDAYPVIGVQPFEGEPRRKRPGSDW